MAKKDKKVNAWQIIAAVFQALAALFGSLKKSHDSAKAVLKSRLKPAAVPIALRAFQDPYRQKGLR